MVQKLSHKEKIKFRIRKKITGTPVRPRLTVYRSNTSIYAQLIDDSQGMTIVSASSRDKGIIAQKGTKVEKSVLVGKAIAVKAKDKGVESCVFDRNGNLYHGRIKAVADGAREAGLKF